MDTLDFLKERKRMCSKSYDKEQGCKLCTGFKNSVCIPFSKKEEDFETAIKIVETWSRKNPVKSRMTDFLEKYPRAILRELTEIPRPCAQQLGYFKDNDKCTGDCCACWHEPIN